MTTSDASDQPIVHTPGPWSVTPKYFDEHGEALVQIECSSHMIGEIYVCDGAEGEANARLIAAAPELLEALEESLALNVNWSETAEDEHLRHLSEYKRVIEQAKAVIEKATKVV